MDISSYILPPVLVQFLDTTQIDAVPGRRCIDGRYLPRSAESGKLARPAGDFGLVTALIATSTELELGWSAETCAANIYYAVSEMTGSFNMHTSLTPESDGEKTAGLMGCKHLRLATMRSAAFRLDSFEVHRAYEEIVNHADKYPLVRNRVLSAHHHESALVINQEMFTTFEPQDESGFSCFVYDAARDVAFCHGVAGRLNLGMAGSESFFKHLAFQTSITLAEIGSHIPTFHFDRDICFPLDAIEIRTELRNSGALTGD